MRLRSAELAIVGIMITLFLFLPFVLPARAEEPLAEPSLVTILQALGYTNIVLSTAQTFPAGTYEARLLAEYGSYHETNTFSYYPTGTNNFILLFSGPEGNFGYVTPPLVKTFTSVTTFGFSMYVAAENHRYFTQTYRNPDCLQHARVYQNLDSPGMYFVGFENGYGSTADRDYNDMVVCLCPPTVEYYLTVQTQPTGVTAMPGEGWYSQGTDVVLTAPATVTVSPGVRYSFGYWDVDGASQGAEVNPITVDMSTNHTATAHYTLQYYLTVLSPYDTPTPTSMWLDAGAPITASVTSPWAGVSGTRYVCTGWTGTGSVPASGTAALVAFTINAPSSITWNWKTQHYLTITHTSGGVTDPSSSGWYDAGTTAPVLAIPDASYMLYRWELDGSPVGSTNPYNVPMNSAHTLHAVFDYAVGGSTSAIELHLTRTWMGFQSILAGAFCVAAFFTKKRRKRI